MTLDALNTSILAVRQQAVDARAAFTEAREAVTSDNHLSNEGKTAQIAEARKHVNDTMRKLQETEISLIERERERVERKLAGRIGSTPDAIIAYRDAQDRAEALGDRQTAQRTIERALRSGDESLANAVAQRALAEGWSEASDLYMAAHPELAADLADRAALHQYSNDISHVFHRGAMYSGV